MSSAENIPQYDYIIVGAGSAGCALAYHLSREASRNVLLLEAGGKDSNPLIHIPLGFAFLMKDPKLNWCYETDPEPQMNQRKISWPRGKVLGGSSSINGMVYIRGQKADYDEWAAAGNKGWGYDDVLPYFKRGEHYAAGENHYHGYGGPLWVEEVENKFELADLFVQAGIESGIPHTEDFNGEQQEGMGFYQLNIKNGLRQSTARTFLKLCDKRPNLDIQLHALTQKILFTDKQASGIAYSQKGINKTAQLAAGGEVILCGGAINSPQLLELSGIGDKKLLTTYGIDTVHHLPGVGENLQDHLTVNIQQGLKNVVTFFDETRPLHMMKNIARFFLQRSGLLVHPAAQAGAFFRCDDDSDRADAQIHFARLRVKPMPKEILIPYQAPPPRYVTYALPAAAKCISKVATPWLIPLLKRIIWILSTTGLKHSLLLEKHAPFLMHLQWISTVIRKYNPDGNYKLMNNYSPMSGKKENRFITRLVLAKWAKIKKLWLIISCGCAVSPA